VLPAEWMAEETGQKKRGKTPNGHTSGADAGGGVCVARLYPIPPPLSLPPTLLFMTGPGPCRRRRRLP
jgi:hypothetical protein